MNLNKEFSKWKKENDQHGGQAFSRFIMLKFLDALQETSSDFVFKGGNLLWHYIRTPRETIDLDLATISLNSHLDVERDIKKIANFYEEISFEFSRLKEIKKEDSLGSTITIKFKTANGQQNQFKVDIVYALVTDIAQIKSTTSDKFYQVASIENIVVDKVAAAYQFKSGNTRMKDFDDLWRISQSTIVIDRKKLQSLFTERNLSMSLDEAWIEFLSDKWKRHSSSYGDVPKNLKNLFVSVNKWLE